VRKEGEQKEREGMQVGAIRRGGGWELVGVMDVRKGEKG
jgi:hypothetical protein